MSSDAHPVLAIERELAAGDGDTYEKFLREDAVVIVPGATLDKVGCVAAMDQSPGWDDFDFEAERLVEVAANVVVLSYRFTGRREGERYVAQLSSLYEGGPDGWRLVLHQQTPEG